MKRALITGITGQDGSYLAELLLAKGDEVHGLVRRTSTTSTERIGHILHRLHLHDGDLSAASLAHVLRAVEPDEVYHLAAMSHVGTSFKIPDYTAEVTGMGTVRLLEAIRLFGRPIRFYNAATSELFGSAPPMQSEKTPVDPLSPYAAAKALGYRFTRIYRRSYKVHASSGILFNHEGTRRGEDFVTRKITLAVARIKQGMQEKLHLGNLDAKRDWGFAGDYVAAMYLMLQQDTPDDYVIATGEMHSVKEFVEAAFHHAGLDWQEHVEIDPALVRPTEVDALCGDATKARRVLGWAPTVAFQELVAMMVDADMRRVRAEKLALTA